MAEKIPNPIFTEKQCKRCGQLVEPVTHGEVNEVHGYKLHCPHCGLFVGWSGKTKQVKNDNGERKRSSMWTAKRLNFDFCQMCLREKSFLGKGERLEVHHIISIDEGGMDLPDNIWIVCTACHRLIHHQRIYLHEHQKKFMDAYNALQRFKHENPELYKQVHGKYPDEDNKTGTE